MNQTTNSPKTLISWNVNGIRAITKKGFPECFAPNYPDALCLQEVKATQAQVELPNTLYQHIFWHAAVRKGYSGTAILTKHKPLTVQYGLSPFLDDDEGRVLTLEFAAYFLVNVYTPNAKRDLSRLAYRQTWDKAFTAFLKHLEQKKPVICCGDFNVAHTPLDLARPEDNKHSHGFTQEERDGFSALLANGFVDIFRHFHPAEAHHYTWWSPFNNARQRNIGWRLDYFCLSSALLPHVGSAEILTSITGSDHCPVALTLKHIVAP